MALLEVLISSVIMATGMLAMLSMQTLALGTTLANSHLLQAEWQLNDLLERMKANPEGFAASLPTHPRGHVTMQCETVPGCSPAELAAHDLARWHQRLEALLPAGYGEISAATIEDYPLSARVYRVRVRWLGQDGRSREGGGGAVQMPVSSGIVAL